MRVRVLWKFLTMELVNINSIYFQIIVGEINVSSPISVDESAFFSLIVKFMATKIVLSRKIEEGGE